MNKIIFLILLLAFLSPISSAKIIQDEYANKLPKNSPHPAVYTQYNYESTDILPIKLKITKEIKSENDIYEGQDITFKVAHDVIYKDNIIIKRGTLVNSKINIIISSGMNGIPASIIFSDFRIDGIKDSRLDDTYEHFGQDRSLLVFPLKWALTPFPPTGSLTNFIKGGHVKLKTNKIITIYYHPKFI